MAMVLRELRFPPNAGRVIEAVRESYPGQDADGIVEALLTVAAVLLSEWSRAEPTLYRTNRPKSRRAIADLAQIIASDDAVQAVKDGIARQQAGSPIILAPSRRM